MWTRAATGPFGTKEGVLVYLMHFDEIVAMLTLSLQWLLDEGAAPGLLAMHLTAIPKPCSSTDSVAYLRPISVESDLHVVASTYAHFSFTNFS